jgi:hypothetical protein
MRSCDRDRGAFEVPGLVKLAIAFAVLGLLGYDGFQTIATHLKAESDAQNAAYAASQKWLQAETDSSGTESPTADLAYQAALIYLASNQSASCRAELTAESQGGTPSTIPKGCDFVCTGAANQATDCGSHGKFVVDRDGTVHLVVRREAKTLIFGHLGFLHSMLVAYEQGDANQEQD